MTIGVGWFGTNWLQDESPMDHDVNNQWFISQHDPNMNETEDEVQSVVNVSQCKEKFREQLNNITEDNWTGFCNVTTDTILCWPPTPINQTAVVRCFSNLRGIAYDDTQNATRQCLYDGSWAKSDYSPCKEIRIYEIEETDMQTSIYFIGYTISIITLAIAIGIFTYFKELRCLRNTIHMNLMWSYILFYSVWIFILFLINLGSLNSSNCIYISTILTFSHLTPFFWMFVEGLYLYILVVETLTRENFKLRVYICIGWGIPLIFTVIWAVTISFMPSQNENNSFICPLTVSESLPIDWIFQTPIAIVLLLNIAFLIAIMWVLITKLRSANNVETQQYHKAAKALLVLMPLLGITYVITIYYPTPDLASKITFERIRAVLLSTQGFTVALFYCFLNTEVQNTVRHHFENWKTSRSLGSNRNRSGSRSKDWSPRSRTESLRLYSQPTNIYHKRESCASEVTTTTLVTVNGGSARPSNGSTQNRSPFLHPPRPSYVGNV